ncbi:MAG: polysaccharide biosynthesis tyrosine autokinase [Pseudomonadota bacterium]
MNKQSSIDLQYAEPLYKFASPGMDGSDDVIDFQRVLKAVRQRFGLFVASTLVTLIVVMVMTFRMTPIYTATSSIVIDPREKDIVDFGAVLSGLPPESAAVDTEVEIIRSRSLAGKIVDELNLTELPEYNSGLVEPSWISNTLGGVSSWVASLSPQPETAEPVRTPEAIQAGIRDDAISTLLDNTSAVRVGSTYGIEIRARSEDPELAAEIANAIANQYLVEQLDAKFDATRRANAWLEDRLSDLREEVSTAEAAIEQYRAEQGLITAGNQTLNERQIGDINAQLVIQQAELSEREARLNAVRQAISGGATAESATEALNSPEINDLRRQQADIIRQRADLETRYGRRHPEIQRINSEEANLELQIREAIDRIVTSLENEVSISRQRVVSLRESLSGMRATIAFNNRAMVRLRELERNADASRTIYEAFLTRFKQTNEQEGLTEADARILSTAVVPNSPSFPKKSLNFALSLAIGLAFGAVAIVIAEALDNQISAGDEIETNYQVPFLGNFPKLTGSAKRRPASYLVENPMSAFAEAYRNLRASIMFADLDKTVRTVAITSSQPDEGKTTVSLGLGRISASSGTSTVVIDGDFRRKQLTEIAGMTPEVGFLECLFGEATLDEAIHMDAETNLAVLPLTATRHTPRDVFGSKAFDKLIEELKERFELIIIDTGPILLMAETRVLAGKTDQVVVVSRWRKTTRAALRQTLQVLIEFKANIAGVILNQVDMNRYHRQGYGYANYNDYEKYYMSN